MEEKKIKEGYKQLAKIVGEQYVSMDKEDIVPYCRDEVSQAYRTYMADLVVAPGTVEEIQEILRLCNKIKMPVYPYAFGVNISSTALPRVGGLMLLVRRLDKILEINEETHTATIEPGVTWSKLFFEARKKNLEPLGLGGGPHSGSLVGNFCLGGGNTGGIDINEEVACQVVLPNGEVMWTGSAGMKGHEKLNPWCRVGYGMNLTGVFHGALGTYGVVTKVIRRLYPLRNIEERVQIGFDTFEDCLNGIKDLVDLGISKQVYGVDRYQAAMIGADSEIIHDPVEYGKYENSFPEFLIVDKISCYNEKQQTVYKELIEETVSKHRGKLVSFTGKTQEALMELWNGSSSVAIRYIRHNPHMMTFAMLPPSMLPGLREQTRKIMEDLDYELTTFSNKRIEYPRVWISPWERNESYLYEQEIEFVPEDPESLKKFLVFQDRYYMEAAKYGSAQINAGFLKRLEPLMWPGYMKIVRGIKQVLDPNNIMAPKQMLKDI
jgi:FAD/FMN-containing dehydrogenase